jgi:hypothetical protein
MPWSGRGGSAYSQMEIAEGRKLTTHKSVFIRLPIQRPDANPQDREYLLVWTTTPWTLTSNVACAVNPDLEYIRVQSSRDNAIYYFAKENLNYQRLATEFREGFGRPEWKWPESVPKLKTIAQILKEQGGFTELGTLTGAEMIGWTYSGPFDDLPAQQRPGGVPVDDRLLDRCGATSHRVIDGDAIPAGMRMSSPGKVQASFTLPPVAVTLTTKSARLWDSPSSHPSMTTAPIQANSAISPAAPPLLPKPLNSSSKNSASADSLSPSKSILTSILTAGAPETNSSSDSSMNGSSTWTGAKKFAT